MINLHITLNFDIEDDMNYLYDNDLTPLDNYCIQKLISFDRDDFSFEMFCYETPEFNEIELAEAFQNLIDFGYIKRVIDDEGVTHFYLAPSGDFDNERFRSFN